MYWYTIVGTGGFRLAMVVMPEKDFADAALTAERI
jgi:hypothetical protein